MIFSSLLLSPNGSRNTIWIIGVLACFFGVIDRVIDIFMDNHVSFPELFSFYLTVFLLLSWISLKPGPGEQFDTTVARLKAGRWGYKRSQHETYLAATQRRMDELQDCHLISQLHVLPFPYLSQIYHLLNLKHLETVHSNSLGHLKVIDVYNFKSTPLGGSVNFRTTLTSRLNILKTLRKSIVDVELVLHTPYTIELKVPIYGGKKMIVLFNVFPLSETTHELAIDIYSDLQLPKFVLRIFLNIAALLTLYEDLPYLKRLSERGLDGLLNSARISSHQTMWLFRRFVMLHAS